MATIIWDENYPDSANYESETWMNWFKGFQQSFREKLVQSGLEFVGTDFDAENFSLPIMIASTGIGNVSTICYSIFKLPIGTGETVFEKNPSGDYDDIVSNDYDNTPVYIKFYYRFYRTSTNTSFTNLNDRYKRELFAVSWSISNSIEPDTHNLISEVHNVPHHNHSGSDGGNYYSGLLAFGNKECIIHHSENELYIKIMGNSSSTSKGAYYYHCPIPLIELILYRENGDVVYPLYSSGYGSGSTHSDHKSNSILYVKYHTESIIYNYSYARWNDQSGITALDNYGDIPFFLIDYKLGNPSSKYGYKSLPNMVVVHSAYLNNPYIELVVPYKGHKVKKKFKPLKSLYDSNFTVWNNGNGTASTFAYSIGE